MSKAQRNIVILTGAGISAESGIKTFRDNNGLWEDHEVSEVATPEAFARDPHLVHRFYNARRKQLRSDEVQPNPAHYALAKLEHAIGDQLLVVTQNVDDLHERAGTKNVIHMHGELLSSRCTYCGESFRCVTDLTTDSQCPSCDVLGHLRPDIVWFGEQPLHMDVIYSAIAQADCFVSIGTSGVVYPAAGFVQLAKQYNVQTLEINLEPTYNSAFDEFIEGQASVTVPAFVADFLKQYQE